MEANLKSKTQLSKFRVLLVEDQLDYASLLEKRLSRQTHPSFQVTCAERLQSGLEVLAKGGIDVVLLDLTLPDSRGLETFLAVQKQAPNVPVVILTGTDNEGVGLEAVQRGAQDYLVKGQVDGKAIPRILGFAIERHRKETALHQLSLIDPLTDLHNRRGFSILTEQQMKLACRTKKGMLLFFIDVDGLKQINDTYGHPEGDKALMEVAEILKITFRKSDIIARIGGDEFAAVAIEAYEDNAQMLLTRLQGNLKNYNALTERPFTLSLSVGITKFDPGQPSSLEELMADADKTMYRQKQMRHSRPR